MARYRVTTPDTARVPGVAYADFEAAQECASPVCVRHLLTRHSFIGCTVHRKRRESWVLEFDSSRAIDSVACAAHWHRVELSQ
jgi:hypothetical protein